ncbi:hypothetical protein [Desemzia sp. FAM 23990]|uniref:hypothetical protein n=1 Tax=Desemzia sp. FAM 23990 TaxID=3259520 RepID=UPI003886F8DC
MSNTDMFYKEFKKGVLLEVNTGFPAKVIWLSDDRSTASVQPLFLRKLKSGEKSKQTPIYRIPVVKHCRPDIGIDGLVICLAMQRSIDNMDGVKLIDPDSTRLFNDNDSVVIGVIE